MAAIAFSRASEAVIASAVPRIVLDTSWTRQPDARPDEESPGSVLGDGEAELRQVGVDDGQSVASVFSPKVRRRARSLMVVWMGMAVSPLSISSVVVRSKGTGRRFWTDDAARAAACGLGPNPA